MAFFLKTALWGNFTVCSTSANGEQVISLIEDTCLDYTDEGVAEIAPLFTPSLEEC